MGGFQVERIDWDGEAALAVASPGRSARAVLALRGATLISWRVDRDGEVLELTDGYRDAAELREQSGVRNGVMAPFPNRVADARYRFGGRDHDLLPGVEGDRTVYHGFARDVPFVLGTVTTTDDSAHLVLRSGEIRPGRFAGYPFALDLTVAYTLTEAGITLEVAATNTGDTTAPYAAGWHPYFRLGGATVDRLELRIPAGTLIRTDDALIPLDGPGCRVDLDDLPEMDFRAGKPVGHRVIDACYADLDIGPDGRAETVLRDPGTGRELRVWQETGFVHVFTGDTLPRDQRASIAIEPVEVMTNAFNRAEFAAAIPLPPGQTRRFRCGVALAAGAPSTALGAAEVDVADGEDLVRGVDQPRAGQLTVVDGGGDGGGDR
jgi:aldose 1-epimerase